MTYSSIIKFTIRHTLYCLLRGPSMGWSRKIVLPQEPKDRLRRRIPTIEIITFWGLQLFELKNLFRFYFIFLFFYFYFVYSSSSGQSSNFQGHFSIVPFFSRPFLYTYTHEQFAGKLVKIMTWNKKIPNIYSNVFRKQTQRLSLNLPSEFHYYLHYWSFKLVLVVNGSTEHWRKLFLPWQQHKKNIDQN